jgi:hypothetical protein
VVVEIDDSASSLLDTRLARRLIQLELSDLDIPPDPVLAHSPRGTALFFRVSAARGGATFRVELWDHGEFCGARLLTGERGSPELGSRRVALAAAELARRLHQRRLREIAVANAKRKAAENAKNEAAARVPRLALSAGALAAWLGPGDAWLAGPELRGELRLFGGARLGVGVAWLAGALDGVPQSPGLRWFELSLSPSWTARLAPSFDLDAGLTASAAVAHFTRVSAVDGIAGELDTWSARAALHLLAEPRLARGVRLEVGPEIGALLRPLPFRDDAGIERHVGGLWLGATLGVVLDPRAPR